MAKTGKDDPCYCGSGLAYHECCYNVDVLHGGYVDAERPGQSILSKLENRAFGSLEEAREAVKRLTEVSNHAPLDDFCGLNPEQMYRFLHHPFDSSDLVTFNLELKRFPESPFFRLFSFLLSAAKEQLKATAQGKLPVKLVREAAIRYYGEEKYQDRMRYLSYRTETDFPVLHTVRLVTELSGFIRKFKGRFRLTKDGAELAEKGIDGRAFLRIFTAYTRKFNWSYTDRHPELHIIQQAFLFTLYVLAKFGGEFRPASFYEDSFLTAFPAALRTVPESSYATPEQTLKRCFSLRALSRFGHFFGFVEFEDTQKRKWLEQQPIRKTRFLDEWVQFQTN